MIPALAALALLAPTPEGQWTASSLTPAALASKVDAALAGLRNTTLSYELWYQKGDNSGAMKCVAKVYGPDRYWMQVPNVNPKWRLPIVRERWISDGKRFGRAAEPEFAKPGPLSRRPALSGRPASDWFYNFSRIVQLGLASSNRPFSRLVADARRSGYRVVAEQRQYVLAGKPRRQYRAVLARNAARYEIDVDGQYMLPTAIVNFSGPHDNTRWSAVSWKHSRKPLDPRDLAFRKPGRTTILSPAPRPR